MDVNPPSSRGSAQGRERPVESMATRMPREVSRGEAPTIEGASGGEGEGIKVNPFLSTREAEDATVDIREVGFRG